MALDQIRRFAFVSFRVVVHEVNLVLIFSVDKLLSIDLSIGLHIDKVACSGSVLLV